MSAVVNPQPNFGIMFDIDGVIVRGKRVLPSAPAAFQRLVDPDTQKFKVPAVFVTNAGNSVRQEKADKLSEWLNIPIAEDQVGSLLFVELLIMMQNPAVFQSIDHTYLAVFSSN